MMFLLGGAVILLVVSLFLQLPGHTKVKNFLLFLALLLLCGIAVMLFHGCAALQAAHTPVCTVATTLADAANLLCVLTADSMSTPEQIADALDTVRKEAAKIEGKADSVRTVKLLLRRAP